MTPKSPVNHRENIKKYYVTVGFAAFLIGLVAAGLLPEWVLHVALPGAGFTHLASRGA
ncbi:hypothetical protein [Nannocystis pusilla]|uniref:hypothetical protein n=1 Tax=Nannocystis pusilla TaxID=889268 RepID=UPI003B835FC8